MDVLNQITSRNLEIKGNWIIEYLIQVAFYASKTETSLHEIQYSLRHQRYLRHNFLCGKAWTFSVTVMSWVARKSRDDMLACCWLEGSIVSLSGELLILKREWQKEWAQHSFAKTTGKPCDKLKLGFPLENFFDVSEGTKKLFLHERCRESLFQEHYRPHCINYNRQVLLENDYLRRQG